MTTYRVAIDVSRLSDTGTSGDAWDRWCQQLSPTGETVPAFEVVPRGTADGVDTWDVEARRPSAARAVVARYAARTDCDVSVLSVERIGGAS